MSTLRVDTLQTTDSSFTVNVEDLAVTGDLTAENVSYKARTVASRLDDVTIIQDYPSFTDAFNATGNKPMLDTASGKVFFSTDPLKLNYTGTKAGAVFQHRDTADAIAGAVPGTIFQFTTTGNGVASAGAEVNLSETTWNGVWSIHDKHGDASAHAFTGLGQLNAVGPAGYNEFGLFQGQATNLGSVNGYLSGAEMLLLDGFTTNGGASWTSFDTGMQAVVGRIARFNAGARPSACFVASSEGEVPVGWIFRTNVQGLKQWNTGFDLSEATLTSSDAFIMKPSQWITTASSATGTRSKIFGSNGLGETLVAIPSAGGTIRLIKSGLGATVLQADETANDAISIMVGGALKRITVGAADSGGSGFRMLRVTN